MKWHLNPLFSKLIITPKLSNTVLTIPEKQRFILLVNEAQIWTSSEIVRVANDTLSKSPQPFQRTLQIPAGRTAHARGLSNPAWVNDKREKKNAIRYYSCTEILN